MTSKIKFIPLDKTFESAEGIKLLVVARRNQVPIRFGCGACKCGTCGVEITGTGKLSPMQADENALLTKMALPTDGTVRLACRAKTVSGEIIVDLAFQDKYTPFDFSAVDEDA